MGFNMIYRIRKRGNMTNKITIEDVIKKFDYIYFFNSYDDNPKWENRSFGELKEDTINKEDIIKWCRENKTKVRKYLRENGFKFYTTDDDYITKCYGYYIKNWHDGTITVDFEPLDQLTEGDLGHVHMLYKDKKANTGYKPL
jgi:hypothetical protein